MDSSHMATLKPTIASRRPMLTSQRSLSNLVINTSATHKDFMRKEKPTMSPEELSSKIADSFQQFSSMLSQLSATTKPAPSPITSPLPTSVLPPQKIPDSPQKAPTQRTPQKASQKTPQKTSQKTPQKKLPPKQETKQQEHDDKLAMYAHPIYDKHILDTMDDTRLQTSLLTQWFTRAASINDLDTLKQITEHHPEITLVNEQDDSGMTALMYTAYFGYIDCTLFLLSRPHLNINLQDKNGWTALLWAVLGNQMDSVKILLDHGIDVTIKTRSGKTVFDYPWDQKSLLGTPPKEEEHVVLPAITKPTTTTVPYDVDFYYQTSIDGYNHYVHPPDFSQLLKPPKKVHKKVLLEEEEEEVVQAWAASIKSLTTFVWHQCLPDQMFVFSESDLHVILDHAFHVPDIKSLMHRPNTSLALWQPANIVFLSARFAHYYSTRQLLVTLLNATETKLSKTIKASSRDLQGLSYWIANLCQLASYLKKDLGLSVATSDAQAALSDLISEAYGYFVSESQRKLEKLLDTCMMDYTSFQDTVDFADDWQRFFRRSTSYTPHQPHKDDIVARMSLDLTEHPTSPSAMTHLLSDIQHILQAFHVPASIVLQATAQFFHYLSCEIFNRVLTFKKYLCRSKALQVRMNVSVLEDWVRANKLPVSLNQSLEPLVQLLQLLQCLSQLEDVMLFSSTVQTFDKLNPLQVKRCVQNYRYEISETKLSEGVEKWANTWASEFQRKTVEVLDSPRVSAEEKRNSKFLLPFSVVNTALLDGWTDEQMKAIKNDHMSYSDTIYKEIKFKKQEQYNALDKIFPDISQEWLYNLDKKLYFIK